MKLEQAAREVIRQHSMECLSDKTVDALREALAEPKKPEECENGCPPLQVCDYCQRAEQATVSDGLCGGCAKKAADGWALYCVECWEKAEQEPVAWTRKQFGEDREYCEEPFTTDWKPLYAAPVRTKDLTDGEVLDVFEKAACHETYRMLEGCRAVIAADREKNNGTA